MYAAAVKRRGEGCVRQTFHLTADESDRETIGRVLEAYADGCPVAASVKGSIEISSELELTVA